jgi:hypothetical protein
MLQGESLEAGIGPLTIPVELVWRTIMNRPGKMDLITAFSTLKNYIVTHDIKDIGKYVYWNETTTLPNNKWELNFSTMEDLMRYQDTLAGDVWTRKKNGDRKIILAKEDFDFRYLLVE